MTARPGELTPGHEQGLEQLRRYAAESDGAIAVVGRRGPDLSGRLSVQLSLDCSRTPHRQGGLELADREPVTVLVPARFPFECPRVEVPHLRFAGAPHVQWGREICLYQAPTVEWVPSDGMFGLLRRLLTWYRRAAGGTVDAPGQPLHPPVTDPTDRAGCVVVHADAPSAGDGPAARPWLGAALVRLVRTDRADVHGWLDHLELRAPRSDQLAGVPGSGPLVLGPAVILPRPLSFEFPTTTSALVSALARRDVPTDRLAALLGEIALRNQDLGGAWADGQRPAPSPLYVIVGAPMRGIGGGSGERLTHLAAWRLLGDEGAPLPRILSPGAPGPGPATVGRDAVQELRDWLVGPHTRTSWAVVYDQRPEIVRRRDLDSPAGWLRGKRVLVLGCGAAGAPIAEQCVRAGAAQVTVADKGRVSPGVLVRQPYDDADVDHLKADALANRLRRIGAAVVESRPGDALTTVLGDDAGVPGVDLVVDATANPTVAARLEQQRRCRRDAWPPVASVAVGHQAELGVATLSLPGATGGGLDILRRLDLVARADRERRLDDLADDLFPFPPRTDLFEPEPGCSEPTFVGSAAQVTALASQLFTGLLATLGGGAGAGGAARPMSASVVRLPTGPDRPARPPAQLVWKNDLLCRDDTAGYEVRIAAPALARMRAACRAALSRSTRDAETGGPLFGEIDDACQVVWVSEAREPPSDSTSSSGHLQLGVAGLDELAARFDLASAGAVRFIGAWHTHPDHAPRASETDREDMADLVAAAGHAPHRALLLILGGAPPRWSAWLEGGQPPELHVRLVTRADADADADGGAGQRA